MPWPARVSMVSMLAGRGTYIILTLVVLLRLFFLQVCPVHLGIS